MPINDTTEKRGYPKPNAANLLIDDVTRLRDALDQVDADMDARAPKESPALTGTPTATTPPANDNSSRVATTKWVRDQEFLQAGDEAVTSVAGKTGDVELTADDVSGVARLNSPAFTGTPTAPTQDAADDSTRLATTAFVKAVLGGGGDGGGVGPNAFTFSQTAPASPSPGDEWLDATTGIRYTWLNDGNTSQWVETGAPGYGASGPAGLISIGTVATGAAGSSAQVTNSGTATAAILNFSIPRGETGATGAPGAMGPKAVSIVSPTSSEKVALFYTTSALTISRISSVVMGSSTPSATFSIRFGSDFSQAGTEVVTGGITTTNTTTGQATTSFSNASIPANSWVWLTTSALSGFVSSLNVSLTF